MTTGCADMYFAQITNIQGVLNQKNYKVKKFRHDANDKDKPIARNDIIKFMTSVMGYKVPGY